MNARNNAIFLVPDFRKKWRYFRSKYIGIIGVVSIFGPRFSKKVALFRGQKSGVIPGIHCILEIIKPEVRPETHIIPRMIARWEIGRGTTRMNDSGLDSNLYDQVCSEFILKVIAKHGKYDSFYY